MWSQSSLFKLDCDVDPMRTDQTLVGFSFESVNFTSKRLRMNLIFGSDGLLGLENGALLHGGVLALVEAAGRPIGLIDQFQ